MYKTTITNKTFDKLVSENKFDWKYITDIYKPEKSIEATVDIELWHTDKVTNNQEFLDYCKANKLRPATFNEALQLALDNPDLQRKHLMATYDLGQLCCLFLRGSDGGRYLSVSRSDPVSFWVEDVRFLVVRESLDSKSLSSVPLELGNLSLTMNGLTYKYKQVEE